MPQAQFPRGKVHFLGNWNDGNNGTAGPRMLRFGAASPSATASGYAALVPAVHVRRRSVRRADKGAMSIAHGPEGRVRASQAEVSCECRCCAVNPPGNSPVSD